MKRILLFTSGIIIFGATILWALALSRNLPPPAPSPDSEQMDALWRAVHTPENNMTGQPVIFPPGAGTVMGHSFFPLTGGHALNDCAACHASGIYQGIDSSCLSCHALDDAHNGANGPECATCHTATNWQDATFDHATIGARDCADCHASPPAHFPAPCVGCHLDTTTFQNVLFDHSQIADRDCADCHTPPPNHYPGSCGNCHADTSNFRNAIFNHSVIGDQDCANCHTPPPNHFPGACRNCHMDTSNFRNATFNHSFPLGHGGANGECTACHTNNEFGSYTCANCHSGGDFVEEHTDEGITDLSNCLLCHPGGREADN
jgi:hypothetical protein